MDRNLRRPMTAVAVLVVAGIIRMPLEQSLTEELRQQAMLNKPLKIETRKKIGQGFWAVSLGGLRTLVATALNLRAFGYFEENRWTQLADTYDTIVQLAPHTEYYWDTGSWHMAYNAAAYYQNRSELPELRRRAEWQDWIERGTAFLEEGIRQNPDSPLLWSRLGWIYTDQFKIVDYEKAADAYRHAIEAGDPRPYIRNNEAYALARIPSREDEALKLIRELQQTPRGRVPTMNSLRFVLEYRTDLNQDPYQLALDIFGDEKAAYDQLSNHFLDTRSNFPMTGVAAVLRRLESELGIPAANSVFKQLEELEKNPINPWQR